MINGVSVHVAMNVLVNIMPTNIYLSMGTIC